MPKRTEEQEAFKHNMITAHNKIVKKYPVE